MPINGEKQVLDKLMELYPETFENIYPDLDDKDFYTLSKFLNDDSTFKRIIDRKCERKQKSCSYQPSLIELMESLRLTEDNQRTKQTSCPNTPPQSESMLSSQLADEDNQRTSVEYQNNTSHEISLQLVPHKQRLTITRWLFEKSKKMLNLTKFWGRSGASLITLVNIYSQLNSSHKMEDPTTAVCLAMLSINLICNIRNVITSSNSPRLRNNLAPFTIGLLSGFIGCLGYVGTDMSIGNICKMTLMSTFLYFIGNESVKTVISPVDEERMKKALTYFQLSDDSTMKDVNDKYRIMSRKYHPDKGGSLEEFHKLQMELNILRNYFDGC